MLDPGSALTVATATLQFISFSLETLELCRQIRDDTQGATAANKALEASTKELNVLLKDLQAQPATTSSQAGKSIRKISTDCIALADDLQKLLVDVRGGAAKKPLGAANATFKALRGSKKIEKLKNALKDKQALLDTAVNHDVRYENPYTVSFGIFLPSLSLLTRF